MTLLLQLKSFFTVRPTSKLLRHAVSNNTHRVFHIVTYLMHEKDRLGGALLPTAGVCILITNPRNVIYLFQETVAANQNIAMFFSHGKADRNVWWKLQVNVVKDLDGYDLKQEKIITSCTSGPRIFQSNPASSSLTRPFKSAANFSATLELPVNNVILGSACRE